MQSFFILFLLIAGLGISDLYSQNNPESSELTNNQYWLDIIPHFRLSDKFEIYGDVSFRIREVNKWQSITIRPTVKYQISTVITVHAGLGLFMNYIENSENITEFRPWQGVRIGFPYLGPVKVKHFLRLEERFFDEKTSLSRFNHFRGRYRIGTKIPINNKYVRSSTLYIPMAFEWLATANKELDIIWASQLRATLGLGYSLSKIWIIEFEYMRWWNKDLPYEVFEVSDNVFRIRVLMNGWLYGE